MFTALRKQIVSVRKLLFIVSFLGVDMVTGTNCSLGKCDASGRINLRLQILQSVT